MGDGRASGGRSGSALGEHIWWKIEGDALMGAHVVGTWRYADGRTNGGMAEIWVVLRMGGTSVYVPAPLL